MLQPSDVPALVELLDFLLEPDPAEDAGAFRTAVAARLAVMLGADDADHALASIWPSSTEAPPPAPASASCDVQGDARHDAIVRMIAPALVAGYQARVRFGSELARIIDMVDTLGHAVRVCDQFGRRLHRSRALVKLTESDPDTARVMAGVDVAIRAAVDEQLAMGGAIPAGMTWLSSFATDFARYRVSVSRHVGGPGLPGPLLMASVSRLTSVPMSVEDMRDEFGLTPAEARVATLLAAGLSNQEIAARLDITPHTARRHTERLLPKLGVHSRAAVAGRILR